MIESDDNGDGCFPCPTTITSTEASASNTRAYSNATIIKYYPGIKRTCVIIRAAHSRPRQPDLWCVPVQSVCRWPGVDISAKHLHHPVWLQTYSMAADAHRTRASYIMATENIHITLASLNHLRAWQNNTKKKITMKLTLVTFTQIQWQLIFLKFICWLMWGEDDLAQPTWSTQPDSQNHHYLHQLS